MLRHQGVLIDVAQRTHRDREGRVTPLDELVRGEQGLYFAGRFPDNPRFHAYQRWMLPAEGWVVGRFTVHPGKRPMSCDWYVDVDTVSVTGDCWHAADHFLDVLVYDGRRYQVHDADELADALEAGAITLAEALTALRSLDRLCRALRRLDFSGIALLREFAQDLPVPDA